MNGYLLYIVHINQVFQLMLTFLDPFPQVPTSKVYSKPFVTFSPITPKNTAK